MKETKKYWKGIEELNNDSDFLAHRDEEFPSLSTTGSTPEKEDSSDTSRRDFLKLMGFSVAAASLAACEAPVRKVIPYINKPVDVDPGKPNYYASTYVNGGAYTSVVVKTREGRPIHIEGNPDSPISKGGVDARTSASVLDLYDSSRLQSFLKDGVEIDVAKADKEIKAALSSSSNIRIVSQSILSPTVKASINEFITVYPNAKQVVYDSVSSSALLEAYSVLPSYNFAKANVVVSFNADFLGTYLSPVEFSKDYSANRKLSKGKKAKQNMSRHYQFETTMSVAGASADYRAAIKPSEEGAYVAALYNAIAKKLGATTYKASKVDNKLVDNAAKDLVAAKGQSLVLSSSNDVNVQLVVKEINALLQNEGATVNPKTPAFYKQGKDSDLASFASDLKSGAVDAVLFINANPVFDTYLGAQIGAALDKVKTKISIADRLDETASICNFVCPGTHFLESWGDAQPIAGSYSIIQPTISPLFNGNRNIIESLSIWSGSNVSAYDAVRAYWKDKLFPTQSAEIMFDSFWDKVLQLGVFTTEAVVSEDSMESEEGMSEEAVESALSNATFAAISKSAQAGSEFELSFYDSVKMGIGGSSNNPWLQELPDPISKVTWDNYLAVSVSDTKEGTFAGLKDGDVVSVTANDVQIKLPILIQPGQAKGSGSIALGYGRVGAGKLQEGVKYTNAAGEKKIGSNAFPLSTNVSYNTTVTIANNGTTHAIARTQTHQTIMGRHNVQETNLSSYLTNATSGNKNAAYSIKTSEGELKAKQIDAWVVPSKDENGEIKEGITHEYKNHHWGLVIDLNSCTGCSACVVSCHAENNVPVVGKDEVLRRRDMHWMRIDRYYSSQAELDHGKEGAKEEAGYIAMEDPAANPEVVFQPMMCQHCNHAPCETVCPVLATTHSSEGLNQMTYNRCIGTRYCANNCPYKVRRFNWFNYIDSTDEGREFQTVNTPSNDDLSKMVLNPDVTVRARGVMEKCSMCVQRVQAGKLQAKLEGRRPEDGEINTACASVCPTDAITFGDMNNPESNISQALSEENSERAYHVLEELNVKPNVSYLTKVRNKA